jgi:hypothetical protein
MIADNARSHTARAMIDFIEENMMKQTLHLAYSPDLARSNFYLFDGVKEYFAGLTFEDADALFGAVRQVLEGIEQVTLLTIFRQWMARFERCITTNGEYNK